LRAKHNVPTDGLVDRYETDDGRVVIASATRNRVPILKVLRRVFPSVGSVLEIASGTGQHAWYFAKHLPRLIWQPTDADEESFSSINAWRRHDPTDNLLEPVRVDVTEAAWPVRQADGMFCSNLLHIAPWEVTAGLMRGAGQYLAPGKALVTYGAYRIGGSHVSSSNEAFDEGLRARNAAWGVRDLEAVTARAEAAGLRLAELVAMPNNNFCAVFRRG
jgi:hypothetical protein